MAETLTELVARIKTDSTELEKGLGSAEKATEASSKKMADSLKKVGMAMAASGAAITAALGLMGKAAIDEDINIKRLATTINNSGTAYDSVKDSLEAVIAATQRKTGVADTEQRNVLGRLILITQDYEKALSLLPTVLDLAAMGEMDATTAATYLSKAYLDLQNGAEEVSVRFGMAAIKFKSMEDIQNRVAGAAEELKNPLSALKATIGDVAEAIGMNLIPMIKGAVDKIYDITLKVQEWAKEHPELAKTLTLVALAVGAILTVAGGLILAMPVITSMVVAFGVVFHAALGPIGLISLAIAGLITAGILLWKNWDKVSHFFVDVWSNMKNAVLHGVDAMLGYLEKFMGWIPGIGDKIKSARDAIAGMIDRERISRDIKDLERDLEGLTKTVKEEFDKQANEIQASYDKQRRESEKAYDAAVEAINKEYGIGEAAKDVSKTRIEAAKEAYEVEKGKYKDAMAAAKLRYQDEMQRIQDVYDLKREKLEKDTDDTVKALQQEIDAIDQQTEREELAITRSEESKRLAELKGAYESAENDKDAAKAYEAWKKYETEVARNELLRTRTAEKDALRQQIADARDAAITEKDRLKELEDAELSKLKRVTDEIIATLQKESDALDTALEKDLIRIEANRISAITAQQDILDETLKDIKLAEKADITALIEQLKRANTQVKEINLAYDNLQKRYDIEIVTHQITVGGGASYYGGGGGYSEWVAAGKPSPPPGLPSGRYAEGGIVPGPIGMPRLATVHGGETIIPANESMGRITVNFTQPVFFDREDTMNRFVDMIRKGIQRQDRLRFGGAYSG